MRIPDAYWPWFVGLWAVCCLVLFAAAVFVDSRLMLALIVLLIVMAVARRPMRCADCGQHQLKRYVWPERRFDPDTMTMPPRCPTCGGQLPADPP